MKFLRRNAIRHSKLGKNRKKLQKWRKPKGRDNKMREKRFGYPKRPNVGYKSKKKESGKIDGKIPIVIYTKKNLDGLTNKNIIILGRVGARKKLELIKAIQEKKLNILNVKGDKNAA